ncbi:MAG: hypothetical protein SFY69_13590 [Planctomycetota bacterium]|nr:hypothetical protein [Planctomycetota bacterium]
MNDRTRIIEEAHAAREQARRLLRVLLESVEAAKNAPHDADLYRRVSGASSLENAAAATRRTIDAYDRLLRDVETEVEVVSAGDIEHAPRIMVGPMTLAALYAARTA